MLNLAPTTTSQLEKIDISEPFKVAAAKKLFAQIERHSPGGPCQSGAAPSALWLLSALGKLAEQQPEMNVQTVLHLAAEAMPKATEMYAVCIAARNGFAGTRKNAEQ